MEHNLGAKIKPGSLVSFRMYINVEKITCPHTTHLQYLIPGRTRLRIRLGFVLSFSCSRRSWLSSIGQLEVTSQMQLGQISLV